MHLAQQEGIIPAHAGFTTPPPASFVASEDHPRTRGVYPFTPSHSPSPHWIIPAHAGFTSRVSSRGSRSPDHPRTRGVYSRSMAFLMTMSGSSPHTRGLRWWTGAPRPCRGIIPAHAGFTCWRRRGAPGDSGSSPHTRGLPVTHVPDPTLGRIIPAHAGFTSQSEPCIQVYQDHPRTRGVYLYSHDPTSCRSGSSPHTRGLRYFFVADMLNDRIIPAHAGFTMTNPKTRRMIWDHPRTRGVYPPPSACPGRSQGSSPHTRGLPSPGR